MDKITVVCHKDHVVGYEDFQGKCLLCVVDELMLEIGNLMIQKQRAEKREWVGLTEYQRLKFADGMHIPLKAVEKIETKLKEKNT